ncbi:MAG: hypothetical protein A2Z99_06045 [Treponema sp. GWB1_62_6]|nr:MAG: hypothetical protein A2001_01240 [Treponema sp. GWC1_61_84]OHE70500.1 MAG: hypothetical protein A2413_19530 [Treponema sp. RIFOXYC1_FULL_61_9]OHE72080.1 MAG: hypothetical protein A2Z99_06045 [Treponema sp. GWB1_62_6]
MKVVAVKDITRKDVPIYYRRVFTATAVLEILNEHLTRNIEFIIETKPTGAREVTVNLLELLEYPLVPVLRELRESITAMDKNGALP